MIWVIEHLDKSQLDLIESMEPFIDFQFDSESHRFLWKTYCKGFELVYQCKQPATEDIDSKIIYYDIPIELIDLYPEENSTIDNTPLMIDSFDYIYEKITKNEFDFTWFNPIRVVRNGTRFYTIDKQRLQAFRKANKSGYDNFENIPARISDSLDIEIRKIRLYRIQQITRGFVCNNWEEARMLSDYMSNNRSFGLELERHYKWMPGYLKDVGEPLSLKNIAMPLSVYLQYYSSDEERLDQIPFEEIKGMYLE